MVLTHKWQQAPQDFRDFLLRIVSTENIVVNLADDSEVSEAEKLDISMSRIITLKPSVRIGMRTSNTRRMRLIYLGSLLERGGLVHLKKGLDDFVVIRIRLDGRIEDPLEVWRVKGLPPTRGVSVDAPPQLGQMVTFGGPDATADEGVLRLTVYVVASVRALAPGSGEAGGKVWL